MQRKCLLEEQRFCFWRCCSLEYNLVKVSLGRKARPEEKGKIIPLLGSSPRLAVSQENRSRIVAGSE